jgi:PKD repeat protein
MCQRHEQPSLQPVAAGRIHSPGKWDFNLSASGAKIRGNQVVDLSWNPVDAWVEIYRDGLIVGYADPNTGFYRDNTRNNGNHGTYVHKVCATEQFYLPDCSNEVTTIFGDGGDGGGGEEPNSPPSADFTYLADKLTVQFTDTSTDSDGTITGWSWDFGDGNSSIAQHPLHTFSVAGTYAVSLTVTDNDGGHGKHVKKYFCE